MFDASKLIEKFHDDNVRLTQPELQDIQKKRDLNVERLKGGLEENSKPKIVETINQGGNAMKTMTQSPEADESFRYDIDLGVVFEKGDSLTPKTTRTWVRDAIAAKATNLKTEPEAKKKCVRVVYADGYQCDFPVFRRTLNGTSFSYEIAIGDEWKASDPAAINQWFEQEIKAKSPEGENGFQLRRIARLVKYFSKVHAFRKKQSFPAGLVVTALTIECYVPVANRDDESFYKTLENIAARIPNLAVWANGINISDEKTPTRLARLSAAANEAVEHLADLTKENDVNADVARKAWKKVFRHSFFDEEVAKSGSTLEVKSVTVLSLAEKKQRLQEAVDETNTRGTGTPPWAS
ncbi:cyclic GMP-AMP synthase DncV-like nucleotidyltransferase [Parvibaculum sp.]|uniref:cyclic GMP-AMP synthase DncV-like nucleotidyltransferase n=1 Tax=Parvibaculum sp. TaxID=2024848 RepID=UPI003BA9EA2E